MKFAVDTMNRRKSGEIIASFFIHGRGIRLQRTPLGIFRALLNSLLLSFPKYLAELTEVFQDKQKRYGSYEQKNGWQWNEKELEKFLSRLLIEGTKDQSVVIFVDALDECGEEDAKRLLVSLKSLIENAQHEESLVRICFSSRHFPILGHETMARVYVEEKNDQDIRLVIEGRLKELQPVEKRREIEKEIMLKAHGGFQWAMLITNMILDEDATGARTEDLLNMISTTPPDLDDLYDFILRGATKDKHRQMEKLFQWVFYTKRPLSAQELREALATDQEMTYTTVSELRARGNWSDCVSQFEMRVRHISRGLVEFQNRDVYEQYEPGGEEWSREAQFIHQSAADFVAQKFLTNIEEGSLFRSPAGAGHFEISRSFLRYLTLEEILNGNDLSREKLSATFPLMPYGVTFLLDHIRGVEEGAICQADLVTLIQWNQPERLRMLARIWRIMDPRGTHAPRGWPFPGASVLHLAIAFGSASLLDTLLQRDSSHLDAKDLEENTPLQLALRGGCQDLALMILERSRAWQIEIDSVASEDWLSGTVVPRRYLGHVNTTNLDGETPLSLAVSIKADRVIRGLIDAGADIKHEKSLMFYAISQEDKALVYQLINEGSDLDGAVFFTTQCLNRTNGNRHILHELLEALLEGGGNTSRHSGVEIYDFNEFDEDEEDEEAIFVATRGGMAAVVSLLLSYGSSADTSGPRNGFPILLAVKNHHSDVTMMLFRDSPGTIFHEDYDGVSAIEEVIVSNQVNLALLFAKEPGGVLTLQELLFRAVQKRGLGFVDTLLRRDEDMILLANQMGEDETETPFLTAVCQGDVEMVSLLLLTGRIDISIRTRHGSTPLFLAVRHGYLDIAKLLLQAGKAAIGQENLEERALAAKSLIVEYRAMDEFLFGSLLLGNDSRNLQKRFWWSIETGQLRMMKFLLDESSVDVNHMGCYYTVLGQTPLSWAIQEGKRDVVEALLNTSRVDLNLGDVFGSTPCRYALDRGEDRFIQLLLDSTRFDIYREDDETAHRLFWWAARKGNDDVVDMLDVSGKFGINTKDHCGRTPLICAAMSGAYGVMRVLLKTGKVDIHVVDNKGDTALSMAVKRGHRTMADLLSAYMNQSRGLAVRVAEY
ncbi:putative ankyrin repeat protein [Fusarium oxysporum f. sp. cubense]|uniref:Putative ankyrin repeat protein n=1 Tax=Fusarium oxysporum f. sp. cubense TaxID=61366 RepID=A0A559KKD7_FUSOC|nr:putative ankyrin repeat protein [Fusarium oxysporum f. sp. cubense]